MIESSDSTTDAAAFYEGNQKKPGAELREPHSNEENFTRGNVGYPGQNDRWSDISPEAIERRKRELHAPLKNYEDIIARLNRLPNLIEQTVVLLKKGLESGVTPPRITLRDVPQQVKNQMEADPEKNAFVDFTIK